MFQFFSSKLVSNKGSKFLEQGGHFEELEVRVEHQPLMESSLSILMLFCSQFISFATNSYKMID